MLMITGASWVLLPALFGGHIQQLVSDTPTNLWRQQALAICLACLTTSSIYILARTLLGLAGSSYDVTVANVLTRPIAVFMEVSRLMFQSVAVFGTMISAGLYGYGTVAMPVSVILWTAPKVSDDQLDQVRENIEAVEHELVKLQCGDDVPRHRGAPKPVEQYEEILLTLQQQYAGLLDARTEADNGYQLLHKIFAWVMAVIGLHRIVSAAANVVLWRTPGEEFIAPLVEKICSALPLPRWFDVAFIGHMASLAYVSVLIGNSVAGFTKALNTWVERCFQSSHMKMHVRSLVTSAAKCLYGAGAVIIFKPAFKTTTQHVIQEVVGRDLDKFYIQFDAVFVVSVCLTFIAFALNPRVV